MKQITLAYEFVDHMPDKLADGRVYVSIPFATAAHNCCCGCGNEVVTPLSPTGWSLTYDGETVSLYPSIGNWSLSCRSHYWITQSKVKWARRYSQEEIEYDRERDRVAKTEYFRDRAVDGAMVTGQLPRNRPKRKVNWKFWRRAKD